MRESESLESIVMKDVPYLYIEQLVQKLPLSYPAAYSRSFEDNALGEIQAKYMHPHNRFCLTQAIFEQEAQKLGLEVYKGSVEKNGFEYPIVKCGRLRLTIHHTNSINSFPETSEYRKQHSSVNKEFFKPFLPYPEIDDKKLSEAGEIYANILHGCNSVSGKVQELGFLRIAFPCKDMKKWAENIDMFELHIKMKSARESERQKQTMVDIAIPKIKVKVQ